MNVEKDLHSLRWGVSADSVQARVMEAARRAVFELGRPKVAAHPIDDVFCQTDHLVGQVELRIDGVQRSGTFAKKERK